MDFHLCIAVITTSGNMLQHNFALTLTSGLSNVCSMLQVRQQSGRYCRLVNRLEKKAFRERAAKSRPKCSEGFFFALYPVVTRTLQQEIEVQTLNNVIGNNGGDQANQRTGNNMYRPVVNVQKLGQHDT